VKARIEQQISNDRWWLDWRMMWLSISYRYEYDCAYDAEQERRRGFYADGVEHDSNETVH
jgi:hypothetical protein